MNQKGLAPIIIILLIAIVFIGGGYLLIEQLMPKDTPPRPITAPLPIPTQEPIAHWEISPSTEIPGWLTAVDTKNNFSLSYPSDWNSCISPIGGLNLFIKETGEKKGVISTSDCYEGLETTVKSNRINKVNFAIPSDTPFDSASLRSSYTHSKSGNYTAKLQVRTKNGLTSDVCTGNISVE